jgi:hypothetical protein
MNLEKFRVEILGLVEKRCSELFSALEKRVGDVLEKEATSRGENLERRISSNAGEQLASSFSSYEKERSAKNENFLVTTLAILKQTAEQVVSRGQAQLEEKLQTQAANFRLSFEERFSLLSHEILKNVTSKIGDLRDLGAKFLADEVEARERELACRIIELVDSEVASVHRAHEAQFEKTLAAVNSALTRPLASAEEALKKVIAREDAKTSDVLKQVQDFQERVEKESKLALEQALNDFRTTIEARTLGDIKGKVEALAASLLLKK